MTNSMGPSESRSPGVSRASRNGTPLSRESAATARATTPRGPRKMRQCSGWTPGARSLSVDPGAEPMVHLAVESWIDSPSREVPDKRMWNGANGWVSSKQLVHLGESTTTGVSSRGEHGALVAGRPACAREPRWRRNVHRRFRLRTSRGQTGPFRERVPCEPDLPIW